VRRRRRNFHKTGFSFEKLHLKVYNRRRKICQIRRVVAFIRKRRKNSN